MIGIHCDRERRYPERMGIPVSLEFVTAVEQGPRLRRWIPLSLKMFAAILAAVGVVSGIWLVSLHIHYRRQMEAVAVIERIGGSVDYRYDAPQWLNRLLPDDPPWRMGGLGPNWIREWLPVNRLIDYSLVVEGVSMDNGPGMTVVSDLSGERVDDAGEANPTDQDLIWIARFPKLKRLYLRDTRIGDAGLRHLQSLQEIEALYLSRTQITDESMEVVAGFEKLTHLRLYDTRLTDAGLARLRQLKHLTDLDVGETRVTEQGLKAFRDRAGLHVQSNFEDQGPMGFRYRWSW
jgi:hypothetical protein